MRKCMAISLLIAVCIMARMTYGVSEENADFLTPEQMKENLEFIKNKIFDIHPDFSANISLNKYTAIYKNIYSNIDSPLSHSEFFFLANQIITPLHSAHTELSYKYDTKILPLAMVWLPDGLGIVRSHKDFPNLNHSRVLAIENIPVEKWLEYMSTFVSHENMEFVRMQASRLITYKYVIGHFTNNPEITHVKLTVEKNGHVFSASVPFLPFQDHPNYDSQGPQRGYPLLVYAFGEPVPKEFISTKFIDELSAGYIELVQCYSDEKFLKRIDDFMREVTKRGYGNLIIDVRKNPGGHTQLTDVILNHMPGDGFKCFSGYQGFAHALSKYDKNPYGKAKESCIWMKSTDAQKIEPFRGKVYVLISNFTFSSSNYLGAIFQDNGLATLVGQRSGNKPCSFGAQDSFDLPNGKLSVGVPHYYFIRPSGDCDTDALIPDVEVPLTLDDVFAGHDPIMEWVYKNISH